MFGTDQTDDLPLSRPFSLVARQATRLATTSAWRCAGCARLCLYPMPVTKPARCVSCGSVRLQAAGPDSGFDDRGAADASDADDAWRAPDVSAEHHRLIGDARRLCAVARDAIRRFTEVADRAGATYRVSVQACLQSGRDRRRSGERRRAARPARFWWSPGPGGPGPTRHPAPNLRHGARIRRWSSPACRAPCGCPSARRRASARASAAAGRSPA